MFRVTAASVEEYFAFDPARESDLRAVDEAIRAAAPTLTRWFVQGTPEGKPGMRMTMIGYGDFMYTVKSSPEPIRWPVVGWGCKRIISPCTVRRVTANARSAWITPTASAKLTSAIKASSGS